MDTLLLHIEYLLTRHDCVIVPGLGAFIATETDAAIDLANGVITPRRREISFNSSVITDDGLLAHSIARREHMSYEEAHRMMTLLTGKMRADLQTEGEISIGLVGRLTLDSEGFINFQPRRSRTRSDIRPDMALLTPKPQSESNNDADTHRHDIQKPEMRTVLVAPDRYVFTVSKRAVHAAAMLIMILTVGISLMLPMNHDNEQKASVISIDELFSRKDPASEARSAAADSISETLSEIFLKEE